MMNVLLFKTLLRRAVHLKFRNFWFMLTVPGIRDRESLVVASGRFSATIRENATINVVSGLLSLNADFISNSPTPGVLIMHNASQLNVNGNFIIYTGAHIVINSSANLNLGSGYINRFAKIRCFKEITIGNNVAIGENVTIWDTDAHALIGKEEEMTQPVVIGDRVWIGTNVTILKGVTIGNGTVIAAGAVVTKSIPADCLAAGVPAKVIKNNIAWK